MSKKKRKSPPWKRNEAVVFVVDWYSLGESPPLHPPPLLRETGANRIAISHNSPSYTLHSFQHSRLFVSLRIFLIGGRGRNATRWKYFISARILLSNAWEFVREVFFFATSISLMIRFKIPDNFNRIVSKTYWEDRFSRSICFPRLSTLFTTLLTFE